VYDLQLMGVPDGAGQGRHQPCGIPVRHRPPGQEPVQTPSVHEFLDNVGPAGDRAEIEDLNDVGVLEPAQCPGLGREPCPFDFRVCQAAFEDLDGDPAAELRLLGQVDHPHPPSPIFLDEDEP
jgi:hypothetical protein